MRSALLLARFRRDRCRPVSGLKPLDHSRTEILGMVPRFCTSSAAGSDQGPGKLKAHSMSRRFGRRVQPVLGYLMNSPRRRLDAVSVKVIQR